MVETSVCFTEREMHTDSLTDFTRL